MIAEKFKSLLIFNVFSIALFLFIEIFFQLFTSQTFFCLVPRETSFLSGVFLMHFDHGNMGHLGSNILPFLLFSSLLIIRNNLKFLLTFLTASAIISGSILWFLGQQGCHIGASALIFALWGFIVFQGIFTRCPKDIIIGLIIGFSYAGFVYGLSPFQEGVSWDGHLYGLISGIIVAFIFRKRKIKQNI